MKAFVVQCVCLQVCDCGASCIWFDIGFMASTLHSTIDGHVFGYVHLKGVIFRKSTGPTGERPAPVCACIRSANRAHVFSLKHLNVSKVMNTHKNVRHSFSFLAWRIAKAGRSNLEPPQILCYLN